MSYSIDIYRNKITPTKDFIAFSAFVSFFPQLVAGPIERATHLLPQFLTSRVFTYNLAVLGLRQILFGLFKKVVIADNCGKLVDIIYDNSNKLNGSSLAIGSILFAFQIYCDFSGYSDMAIGLSLRLGFRLLDNL
jgi:D-alanyl-lipoteichoic acid acyltransferase DltB (MBOAT superfamily)